MLSAIDLNDHTGLRTKEVHDVVAEWLLLPKAESAKLLVAYTRPEALFRLGGS